MSAPKGDHEDDCVGTEKPTIDLINPTSHTDSRPVWFLDEEKGECFRSYDLGSIYYWLGHLEDGDNFGDDENGGMVNSSGDNVEYPFGAEWITIEEGSSLNVINLQDAMDIDHRYDEVIDEETNEDDDTTVLNYFTASNTFRGELRNCLSNDNHGEVEHRVNEAGDAFEEDEDGNPIPVRSEDLSCVYDIRSPNKNANLNDNYLYDTVAVGNAQNSPSLRFVAKQTGDLASEHSDGRLCVVYEDGNTNGAASVSVDTSYDDGVDTSYCENFPYDVLDSTDVDADHCEEHGLHLIELDGSDLTITLNANVDVNTVNGIDHDDRREEDFNFELSWGGTNVYAIGTRYN